VGAPGRTASPLPHPDPERRPARGRLAVAEDGDGELPVRPAGQLEEPAPLGPDDPGRGPRVVGERGEVIDDGRVLAPEEREQVVAEARPELAPVVVGRVGREAEPGSFEVGE
jgi:hypothetical protein